MLVADESALRSDAFALRIAATRWSASARVMRVRFTTGVKGSRSGTIGIANSSSDDSGGVHVDALRRRMLPSSSSSSSSPSSSTAPGSKMAGAVGVAVADRRSGAKGGGGGGFRPWRGGGRTNPPCCEVRDDSVARTARRRSCASMAATSVGPLPESSPLGSPTMLARDDEALKDATLLALPSKRLTLTPASRSGTPTSTSARVLRRSGEHRPTPAGAGLGGFKCLSSGEAARNRAARIVQYSTRLRNLQ
mmetsp:Transcript_35405/g.109199  ORF Transcript_35405/g.109199 Transcript_35405/m.109199 type:complete len:250 (-) Transcript_35405:14-763(-)